jgi:hypothetical protein
MPLVQLSDESIMYRNSNNGEVLVFTPKPKDGDLFFSFDGQRFFQPVKVSSDSNTVYFRDPRTLKRVAAVRNGNEISLSGSGRNNEKFRGLFIMTFLLLNLFDNVLSGILG